MALWRAKAGMLRIWAYIRILLMAINHDTDKYLFYVYLLMYSSQARSDTIAEMQKQSRQTDPMFIEKKEPGSRPIVQLIGRKISAYQSPYHCNVTTQ